MCRGEENQRQGGEKNQKRLKNIHPCRRVSRVTYDSFVVHCLIFTAFCLSIITSSFPHVNRRATTEANANDDLLFRCDEARTTPLAYVSFLKLPGTIVFLGTKNLWRVKAYKSRFCAMRWAVGSTIKTLLKVTLFSFTFAVLYHLYFIAYKWRCKGCP